MTVSFSPSFNSIAGGVDIWTFKAMTIPGGGIWTFNAMTIPGGEIFPMSHHELCRWTEADHSLIFWDTTMDLCSVRWFRAFDIFKSYVKWCVELHPFSFELASCATSDRTLCRLTRGLCGRSEWNLHASGGWGEFDQPGGWTGLAPLSCLMIPSSSGMRGGSTRWVRFVNIGIIEHDLWMIFGFHEYD